MHINSMQKLAPGPARLSIRLTNNKANRLK
jgi:hypothetical protein